MFSQRKTLAISLVAVGGLAVAVAVHAQTSTQTQPPAAKLKAQAPAQQAQPPASPAPPPGGMGPGMGHGRGGMMGRPGMHGGMMGPGTAPAGIAPRMARLMAQLNLSQAQKDQLKAFRDRRRKDTQALHEKMRAARQTLREAMKADVPDENAVRGAAGALAALQADQAALRARAKGQFMKVLTPEQQAQVKEARARAAERVQRQMLRHNRMMRQRAARQWRGWL